MIDIETGEILSKAEPSFVKVYMSRLSLVKGLSTTQKSIYEFLCANMNYNNISCFGRKTKKEFLLNHNIKNQTFNNAIAGLLKTDLVERVDVGEFYVNEKYVCKGSWKGKSGVEWKTSIKGSELKDEISFMNDDE